MKNITSLALIILIILIVKSLAESAEGLDLGVPYGLFGKMDVSSKIEPASYYSYDDNKL